MATDSTLAVRKAILPVLKGAAEADLVPSASIYPQVTTAAPAWPFVRYGAPAGVPVRASCVDGLEVTVALHGFSKGRKNGAGQLIETAEDHAARIGAWIAATLDGKRLMIAGGHAKVIWTGSQLLMDGAEADAFHTVQDFRVRCLT